jgi:hypothetical protein
MTTPAKPKIHYKPPQLTTKPEDRFFPQQTGPTTAIDLGFPQKHPEKIRLYPSDPFYPW